MRKPLLGILLAFLFTLNLMAANVTGRWSGRFRVDGGDHDIPQLFLIKQNGNNIAGTGGPNEAEQYPLEKARINDDHLRFELTTGEWKFAYDLKVDGTKMTGNLELKSVNDVRIAKVSLTKVE